MSLAGTDMQEEQETLTGRRVGPHADQRKRQCRMAAAAVTAVFLVAAVALQASFRGSPTTKAEESEVLVSLGGECAVPDGFCDSPASLEYRDCDGDGILDPYCMGSELLQFGYLGSKSGCKSNWPSGFCKRPKEPRKSQGEFSGRKAAPNEVTIIHFNDVYEVSGVMEGGVRRGGMSRAAHVIEMERRRNPDRTFVVFAGDLLSPSALSDLFEGAHMIDVLNEMGIDAASLGNHEFDLGVDVLQERIKESKFPWLNTNLHLDKKGLIPGTTPRLTRIVPFSPAWSTEAKESKICIFGAAYDVRQSILKDKERLGFVDIMEAAGNESLFLRSSEKCDVVLALTHQFSAEDCKMSKHLGPKLDVILGGHDHSTELTSVCGHAPYVKADSDLKTQWIMTLWLNEAGQVDSVDGRLLSLTDVDPFDEAVHEKVLEWEMKGRKAMGKVVGCSKVPIDARPDAVRQGECAAGNFFADAVRDFHGTDVAVFNGGAIRGKSVYPKGDIKKSTVTGMHPFGNKIAKIYATGAQLKAHIEKSLACYETLCGAFLHISGAKYSFDTSKPAGQRLGKLMHEDGSEIKDDESFTLAITDYALSHSPLRHNKLYDMTTLNDAVPVLQAIYDAVAKAGNACVSPKVDGRIQKL